MCGTSVKSDFSFELGCGSGISFGSHWFSDMNFSWDWGSSWNWHGGKHHHGHHGCDNNDGDSNTNSSDSTIYTGTTNTDGTGTSANLDADNATDTLIGEGEVSYGGVFLSHLDLESGSSSTFASIDDWNANGYKEISIDNNDDVVVVDNFVDVDINNGGDGSYILVNDAKRGQITTADGNDDISIDVYSNNEGWVNGFTIDSGAGNDNIVLADSQNSQYTSFEINAASGNDTVDVSGLNMPDYSTDVTRVANGGSGNDTLVFSGENTVSFKNFEVIQGQDDAALTLSSSLMANNDSGLILSDIDLSFDDSVVSYETDDLSCAQSHYLESMGMDSDAYVALTVCTDEGAYNILTTDDLC